jgi:O-acetyl-ADP-ribose deacetylase (regulator of RNase III)
MDLHCVSGDLLRQPVETIVNAWNQNIIPWWLLRPHGISGAIKREAGPDPFRELQNYGKLALGEAVLTNAGKLQYKGIIHVASITLWGYTNELIIRTAVQNALKLATIKGFTSVAFPVLGSGSGRMSEQSALESMMSEFPRLSFDGTVYVVQYRPMLINT